MMSSSNNCVPCLETINGHDELFMKKKDLEYGY